MRKCGDTHASERVGTDQSYQALDCVYVYARTWTELRTEPSEKEGNARNLYLATRGNEATIKFFILPTGGGGEGETDSQACAHRTPRSTISLRKERCALLRKESNEEIKQKKERNHG